MIIPLYLFLRRFLDEKTSFLTTFIFVMLPLFVDQSVNVIRDPSYWFFSVLGLYLLVYDDEKDTPICSYSQQSFLHCCNGDALSRALSLSLVAVFTPSLFLKAEDSRRCFFFFLRLFWQCHVLWWFNLSGIRKVFTGTDSEKSHIKSLTHLSSITILRQTLRHSFSTLHPVYRINSWKIPGH